MIIQRLRNQCGNTSVAWPLDATPPPQMSTPLSPKHLGFAYGKVNAFHQRQQAEGRQR
jgi:hypothetical protein